LKPNACWRCDRMHRSATFRCVMYQSAMLPYEMRLSWTMQCELRLSAERLRGQLMCLVMSSRYAQLLSHQT
jgi:hypothetical protein